MEITTEHRDGEITVFVNSETPEIQLTTRREEAKATVNENSLPIVVVAENISSVKDAAKYVDTFDDVINSLPQIMLAATAAEKAEKAQAEAVSAKDEAVESASVATVAASGATASALRAEEAERKASASEQSAKNSEEVALACEQRISASATKAEQEAAKATEQATKSAQNATVATEKAQSAKEYAEQAKTEAESISSALSGKQDILTAGEGIKIEGNVISTEGGKLPDNVYTEDNLVAGENVVFEPAEEKINGDVLGSLNITSDFVASGFSDDNVIIANDPINETSNLQSFEICTSFKLYSTTNCGIIDTAGSAGNARWRITLQDGVVRARTMFYASTEADVDIYGTTYIQPGVKYRLKYAYLADTNNGMYGYRLWVLPEGEEFRPDNIQGFHPYVDRPYISNTHNTIRLGDNSAGGNAMDGEIYLGDTYINVNGERAWEAVTKGGKTKVSVNGAYTEDNLIAGENITFSEVLPEGGIDEHTLACWHFDEDLVDEKNNLTLVGSGFEITAEASKFGNCSAKMNSSGDYATVVSDVFADLFTKDFTIDFWLRREEFYVGNTLFGFSDNEGAYDVRSFPFNFALGSAGSSTSSDIFRINDTKIGSSGFSDVKVFGHIAIVFNRKNTTCSLYLNGSKLGEYVLSTLPTNTKNLSFYFPGSGTTMRFDEFRISDCIRYTEDFTPPTEPYILATGPSKKAINAVIPPTELPSDLYRQSNLLGGKDIEIIPEPVEGGIDENTLACWHFDGKTTDEVNNIDARPSSGINSVFKFGEGSASGNWGLNSLPFTLSYNESFSFDFWVYRPYNSWNFQVGFIGNNYLFNVYGFGGNKYGEFGVGVFKNATQAINTTATIEAKKWTHIYCHYDSKTKTFASFVDGKLAFSEVNETTFYNEKTWYVGGSSYIDEVRISNCIRWTEDFTPPTQPYRKAEPTGNYVINFTGEVGGSGKNIGEVYYSQSSLASDNAGALPLFTGETIASANTIYPDFYAWVESHTELQTTAEEYETALTTYGECAKYVVSNGSLRLPKLTNYIKMANTAEGITQKMAGLPDHNHTVSGSSNWGSMSQTGNAVALVTQVTTSNASASNPIYGNSDTVTPAHTTLYPWVFAYSAVIPASAAQAAEFQEGLSGKADANLGNIPTNYDYVVERYDDEQGNWYEVWKSGRLRQGGFISATTSQANHVITFLKPFANTFYSFVNLPVYDGQMDTRFFTEKSNARTTTSVTVVMTITRNWTAEGKGA